MGIWAYIGSVLTALNTAIDAFGSGGRLATPTVLPAAPPTATDGGSGTAATGRDTASEDQTSRQRRQAAADQAIAKLLGEANTSREKHLQAVKAQYAGAVADVDLLRPQIGTPAGEAAIRSALNARLEVVRGIVQEADAEAKTLAAKVRELHYDPAAIMSGMGSTVLPPPADPKGIESKTTTIPTENPNPDAKPEGILPTDLAIGRFLTLGEPEAIKLMSHYADASGKPVVLPPELVDKWSKETTHNYPVNPENPDDPAFPIPVATAIQNQVNAAIAQARARSRETGQPVRISQNSGWRSTAGADGDLVHSLGRFQVSTATVVDMKPDGSYTLTYRPDFADVYDFTGTLPNNSPENIVSNQVAGQAQMGWARPFLVTGSGTPVQQSGRVQ
ncbi:hypothetical protein [Tsukamurella ocularis]|uniref:hypothetical protein n=1 Tax=Tsukamurella ocularis TaxID=1970234 RepID=UPI00216A8540|nr:hypothetical protein [Tsukamurella ocularis]MCS3853299.1 hypothetical protein [Tsukamurella ocularis]